MEDKVFRNLYEWSHEMDGAMKIFERLQRDGILLDTEGKDKRIYSDAIYRLLFSSIDNIYSYICLGRIGFRNHKTNARGKLISCEAYFM